MFGLKGADAGISDELLQFFLRNEIEPVIFRSLSAQPRVE
jgi:hypothetical protein